MPSRSPNTMRLNGISVTFEMCVWAIAEARGGCHLHRARFTMSTSPWVSSAAEVSENLRKQVSYSVESSGRWRQ